MRQSYPFDLRFGYHMAGVTIGLYVAVGLEASECTDVWAPRADVSIVDAGARGGDGAWGPGSAVAGGRRGQPETPIRVRATMPSYTAVGSPSRDPRHAPCYKHITKVKTIR